MRGKNGIAAYLVTIWYQWRLKKGRSLQSEKRLRQLSALYPEQPPERVARQQDETRIGNVLKGLLVTVFLALAAFLAPKEDFLSGNYLRRPEEGSRQTGLSVEVGSQSFQTTLEVHARTQTEVEQEAVLDQAESAMREQMLGENPSWEQVCFPLNLSAECPVDGVQAWWNPREPLLIHWDGTLTTEVFFGAGRETMLELRLNYGSRERMVEVPVILVDREPVETSLAEQVQSALSGAEKQRMDQAYVELPTEIGGLAVHYQQSESSSGGFILFLGMLASLALFFLTEQRTKEALNDREQELELSYSELTAKLKVLVGAGLPVRAAWERMVTDYEKGRENGGKRRILYEEMRRTRHALSQGTMEEQAYAEFGRRCGQAPYLRLGNLLESHIKNGTKGIGELLGAESAAAFQERLTLAKRQGEQISAKLLLPLMFLFGLTLVMLILPAFMGFSL